MKSILFRSCLVCAGAIAAASPAAYAESSLDLNLNETHYLNVGMGIKRVAIGNPAIADVQLLSGTEILVVAQAPGGTTLLVWTNNGQIRSYLVNVSADDVGRAMMIQKAIGNPQVHVRVVDQRILLEGTVKNQFEHDRAVKIASFYNGGTRKSKSRDDENNEDDGGGSGSGSGSGNLEYTFDYDAEKEYGGVVDLLRIQQPTQIRLEAQIVEISSDDAKDLGIEYGTNGSGGIFTFGENYNRATTWDVTEDATIESGNVTAEASRSYTDSDGVSFRFRPFKWLEQRFGPINATIHALVTKGKAKILSRPSVSTMSGSRAKIHIGGRIPVPQSTGYGATSTSWEEYGIGLSIKPVLGDDNMITAKVNAEVSVVDWGHLVSSIPSISSREAHSIVNLSPGSTMVIGGLLNSEDSKVVEKFPLLGDIPIIGEFFKHTSTTTDKRELIILITPSLVSEDTPAAMSGKMQEFYDHGRRERSSMNDVDLNDSRSTPPKDDHRDENLGDSGRPKEELAADAVAAEAANNTEDSLLGRYLNREVLPRQEKQQSNGQSIDRSSMRMNHGQ